MAVLVEPRKEKRFFIGPVNTSPYPAHLHDVVETVVLRKGFLNMTVNGKLYCLEPDTVLMVFPGMTHSYESASEDAEGLFVGFTPGLVDEFHNLLITQWPEDPTVRIADCGPELEEAVEKLEAFSKQEGIHPLTRAYIHLFIACVFTRLTLLPTEEINRDNIKFTVMYYIQQHANENLTLDSVSKELGISRSRLSHLFSQKLHINFRQFLNTIRVEKACQLLQEPMKSVKEVCFECGFESTRTFHRAFLQEQKMTPGEFREKMMRGWVTLDETGRQA